MVVSLSNEIRCLDTPQEGIASERHARWKFEVREFWLGSDDRRIQTGDTKLDLVDVHDELSGLGTENKLHEVVFVRESDCVPEAIQIDSDRSLPRLV